MGSSEISEELTDWEEIQHPDARQPSSPPPQGQRIEFELVINDNFYGDGSSNFPPSEHEDLPLPLEECNSQEITSPPLSPSPSRLPDTDPLTKWLKKSDLRFSVLVSEIGAGICTIGRRVFKVFAGNNRTLFSSVVPATALTAVFFACLKILQWRNRLLLLMREKDQRISELLHQIAHMNEILSARRKVPVLRIN